MAVTRDKVSCVIFGAPRSLPTNVLPIYAELMKKDNQLKQELKTDNGKYPSFFDISHKLCHEVEAIWETASLPTETHAQAIEKLRSFHEKYKTILKVYKGKKNQPNYQRSLSDFRNKVILLYLISANASAQTWCPTANARKITKFQQTNGSSFKTREDQDR